MWPILLVTFFFLHVDYAQSQSPPNTTANIAAVPGFATVADIQTTFNAARRAEETQLGAPANSLGNLVLPAGWDAMADHVKGFFLTNAERTARGGVAYTIPAAVTPIGLPVEMVEANLQSVAQAHGADMLANQRWAHANSAGVGSFARIAANPVLNGCLDFIPRGENLFISCHFAPNNRVVEQAVYGWIYNDLGSANGHREANLLQDLAIGGGGGFTNNYSSAANEGFMAFHVFTALSTVYNPAQFPNACGAPSAAWSYSVAIFNIADPAATCPNAGFGTPFVGPTLPVELASFDGRVVDESSVVLKWETTTESNNAGFAIELNDGEGFKEVGFINGAGTTESTQNYTFEIGPLDPGVNQFRLRQVDFNGAFEMSDVLELTVGIPGSVFLTEAYPNPFQTTTTIKIASATQQQVRIEIYNTKGQLVDLVFDEEVNAGQIRQIEVDGSALSNGIYLAKVSGESFQETVKIVVVR